MDMPELEERNMTIVYSVTSIIPVHYMPTNDSYRSIN